MAFLVTMGIFLKDREVLRATVTVVVLSAAFAFLQNWEKVLVHRRRSQCLHEINQDAAARFVETIQQQQQDDPCVVVFCEYHNSVLGQIGKTAGFYVTLWVRKQPQQRPLGSPTYPLGAVTEDAHHDTADITYGRDSHYYYRILIHKNGWWRKLRGAYSDVPLLGMSTDNTAVPTPQNPAQQDIAHVSSFPQPPRRENTDTNTQFYQDWQEYWQRRLENQKTMRTFHWISDGLTTFFLWLMVGAMLVLQQLQEWKWFLIVTGTLIATSVACLCWFHSRSKHRMPSLFKEIVRAGVLQKRMYLHGGVLLDYRVIVDHQHLSDNRNTIPSLITGIEECHYVYVFVTKPPSQV